MAGEATKPAMKRNQSLNRIEKLFAKLGARKVRPVGIESGRGRNFLQAMNVELREDTPDSDGTL